MFLIWSKAITVRIYRIYTVTVNIICFYLKKLVGKLSMFFHFSFKIANECWSYIETREVCSNFLLNCIPFFLNSLMSGIIIAFNIWSWIKLFLGKVGRHKIYVFMERNVYKRLNIFKVDFIVRFDVNKLREAVMDCVKEVEGKLNL